MIKTPIRTKELGAYHTTYLVDADGKSIPPRQIGQLVLMINAHAGLVDALASCVTVLTIADQIGGPSSAVRANILRDAHAALAAAKGEES